MNGILVRLTDTSQTDENQSYYFYPTLRILDYETCDILSFSSLYATSVDTTPLYLWDRQALSPCQSAIDSAVLIDIVNDAMQNWML